MEINKNEILESFRWIKVKKFNPDDYPNIEDRYYALEKHHKVETNFLIEKIRSIIKMLPEK